MKRILAISVAVLLLTSCQTKQSAIKDLRALSQELAINSPSYSINEWIEAGKEYKAVNQRITKHAGDYNDNEMQEISELNGRCIRSFTTGAVTKVSGAANAIKSFLKGFVEQ